MARHPSVAASAIGWMFDDGGDGPFSFNNVCETLGIDGQALRARVGGNGSAAVIETPPRRRLNAPLSCPAQALI